MEVAGKKKSEKRFMDVELGFGVTLKLAALPFGLVEELETCLPVKPSAITGYARGKGKKFIKDEQGKPVPIFADNKAEENHVGVLRAVTMLHKALADEPLVAFNATWPEKFDKVTARPFAEAVLAELKVFDLNSADFKILMEAVTELSGISPEEVEAAQANFRG